MARYVVLTFDDNDAAEAFVKFVDSPWSMSMEVSAVAAAHAEVESVFAKPTLFCACGVDYTAKAFVRSTKFGWYVHNKCHKPRKEWGTNIRYILGQANDLLQKMREARSNDSDGQGKQDGSHAGAHSD